MTSSRHLSFSSTSPRNPPSLPLPPVPPMPAAASAFGQRKYSSSTQHSREGAGGGAWSSQSMRLDRSMSESSAGTGAGGAGGLGRGGRGRDEGERGGRDKVEDLDNLGYKYSLRVAILHTFVKSTSTAQGAPHSARQNSHPSSNPHTPHMPPIASPSLTGTSPSGSRLTLGYFGAHPSLPSPTPSDGSLPSPGAPGTAAPGSGPGGQRRKSSFGFGLGGKKDKEDELKLPKEFLVEFWGVLQAEQGDQGWKDSVARLLANVKKGTRTGGGANLREVGTLLDAFTQAIPPDAHSPPHMYQHHLLSLLSTYLPRSSYFSPLARQQTEKDRDLLQRLRTEVGTYMLGPGGHSNPAASIGGDGMHSPSLGVGTSLSRTSSPGVLAGQQSGRSSPASPGWGGNALGLGRYPPLPSPTLNTGGPGAHGDEGKIKRKPSPVWQDEGGANGPARGEQAQMPWEGLVARVWGVGVDRVEREGMAEKRLDPVSLYLIDIKRSLTALSQSSGSLSPAQRQRQVHLSTRLQTLLRDFPTLSTPGSPEAYHDTPLSPVSPGLEAEPELHFTPASHLKTQIYARFSSRALSLGLGRQAQELLEQCRETWGIPSRREREAELDSLVGPWWDAIQLGRPEEERRFGRGVEECVRDVAGMVGPGEEVPPGLQRVGEKVLRLAERCAGEIFPPPPPPSSTDAYGRTTIAIPPVPPPPPPTTLMPIFRAGEKVFLVQPAVTQKLSRMADEVRAASVGLYVMAVGEKMGGVGGTGSPGFGAGGMASPGATGMGRYGQQGKDETIEGMEEVAGWMLEEVRRVKRGWGYGLGAAFSPAALILSKQLPLFLAELSGLTPPSPSSSSRTRGQSSDVFPLYEHTAALLGYWDDLCPDLGLGSARDALGFEADSFFGPWVEQWLKEECGEVGGWVGRIVGMDQWRPEGSEGGTYGDREEKASQSVQDLFDFMRQAAETIGRELPLGEYQRAVYLVDLAKTTALAVAQYNSTLQALFQTDLNPAGSGLASPTSPTAGSEMAQGIQGRLGKGAGNWLAKGQQAVKGLELNKKKVEGFVIPSVALVKLSNLSSGQRSVTLLADVMDADECERIISQHKLRTGSKSPTSPTVPTSGLKHIGATPTTSYLFSITVQRGENILSKNGQKAADGFVTVLDRETGERTLKTRTVLGTEDPRWEESFDLDISHPRSLELQVFDRQLVGKHDQVGTALLPLNPKTYASLPHPTRDILLPLSPRGMLRLRITMHGGENHSVTYHLSTAARILSRGEADMVRDITEKMGEYVRTQLCTDKLFALTRPKGWKKGQRTVISEQDVEMALGSLMSWLNENFSTFHRVLPNHLRLRLLLSLWQLHITALIGLIVPPLSDRPYRQPSVSEMIGGQETELIFKWLNHLKAFFNASEDGVEHGVPMSMLTRGAYRDLLIVGQYIDLPGRELRERATQAVKAASAAMYAGAGAGTGKRQPSGSTADTEGRAQSPRTGIASLEQNMGGLRVGAAGGLEGYVEEKGEDERLAEVLLRIARTRTDLGPFVAEQMALLNKARVERQGAL